MTDSVINPADLREIWDAHSDALTLIARSMVDSQDSQDAEDAVQEAYIALAVQTALPDDPLAWLVRVVRNQLLQWRRSQGRRQRREHQRGDHSGTAQAWLSQPQSAIDRRLDGHAVTEALVGLPEQTRQVIVMHLWGELTFQQIAMVTGRSRSSVHRLYSSGLEQLKQRFDPPPSPLLPPSHQALSDESDTLCPRR